ncbi:MAG TPA: Pvc16 family protein [Xanthobacteraceae bacterium]|nr:Pvc16 family protein [Xanthobacteraceae bacterium]
MSNALAIATVTEALRNLLTQYIDLAGVSGAWVSTVSPDAPASQLAIPGINIFLYQITPNAALRNADLPTRAQDGTLLRKPQAAIDLHYLLTFYGEYATLEPQRLLGAATLALHASPVLTPSLIQSVEASNPFLAGSNLDAQTEQIRFNPVVFSLEELSKLWSFLLKIDYVLSTAYVAHVVLIEDDVTVPPPPLPALSYNLGVQTMRQPVITQVSAASPADAPIHAGSNIILRGRNLAAPSGAATQVLIGGVAQTPVAIGPTSITLALPGNLAAGPQTAQVMQPLLLGVPPVLHPGTGGASGIAAFVLHPTIASGSPPGNPAISVIPAFGSPPSPALAVTVSPTVQAGQRVLLQLLQPPKSPPAAASTRLFDGGTLTAASDTVTVPIPGLPSGTYAVQVLVDGAESPLQFGPGGVPIAPLVSV